MRRPLLLVLFAVAALAACGYQEPDYGDVRFRCDDQHACPDGQACVAGHCQVDDDAALDGALADGTPLDGPFEGIGCASATCGAGQECCIDVVSGPRCQVITAGCAGVATQCDGPEDCPGGECCITATTGSCVTAGACATGPLCHLTPDCPDSGDECCPVPQTPWRACFDHCA